MSEGVLIEIVSSIDFMNACPVEYVHVCGAPLDNRLSDIIWMLHLPMTLSPGEQLLAIYTIVDGATRVAWIIAPKILVNLDKGAKLGVFKDIKFWTIPFEYNHVLARLLVTT